jgi:hypothetical protein
MAHFFITFSINVHKSVLGTVFLAPGTALGYFENALPTIRTDPLAPGTVPLAVGIAPELQEQFWCCSCRRGSVSIGDGNVPLGWVALRGVVPVGV